MITTASNLPMDHTSPAMELHQPTTLPRLLPTSTQHSRSTGSLPTASYLATEDTKKDMATLLGHLTTQPRLPTTLSQPMASQPRTEPHLQPTLRNHPILRNQPTLSSQHILSQLWLNR